MIQLEPIPATHALSAAEMAERLRVDPSQGLASADARARLGAYGPNELEPPRRVSVLASIVDAATEPFVVLLAFAGVLAVLLGEVRDGLLILVGLVPIVGADVVTEFRAERALEELRAATAPLANVRRDGAPREVPARELVPGDIVLLRVGDVVPADLRIVRSNVLTIDRSILTGESLPEEASAAADPEDPQATLAVSHLTKRFGSGPTEVIAVRDVSLEVGDGRRGGDVVEERREDSGRDGVRVAVPHLRPVGVEGVEVVASDDQLRIPVPIQVANRN